MADKSCYMGAGGYQANTSNGSGYTREEYACSGASTNVTSTSRQLNTALIRLLQ